MNDDPSQTVAGDGNTDDTDTTGHDERPADVASDSKEARKAAKKEGKKAAKEAEHRARSYGSRRRK